MPPDSVNGFWPLVMVGGLTGAVVLVTPTVSYTDIGMLVTSWTTWAGAGVTGV